MVVGMIRKVIARKHDIRSQGDDIVPVQYCTAIDVMNQVLSKHYGFGGYRNVVAGV